MQTFLKRAVAVHLKGQHFDDGSLHWAAYFAWQPGPSDRTLADALNELQQLTSKKNAVRMVATTTSTTMAATVPGTSQMVKCMETSVSFEPLDMIGLVMSVESDALECQRRCAKHSGCYHFSFLATPGVNSGSCHLTDFSALALEEAPGWVAGPSKCWADLEDTNLLIDKGHKTYVHVDFACMDWGTSYAPALPGGLQIVAGADFPTEQEATLQCQKRCAEKKECQHFTMSFPTRMCTLVGKQALASSGIAGSISGPRECSKKTLMSYYWELLPSGAAIFQTETSMAAATAAMIIAIACLVTASLRRTRRSSARGIQRGFESEDDTAPFISHGA